ncbi:hypothetical protein HJC23_007254 [Cyclotella cryptica]|uniref:Armadillo repeat-containing protein 6 n=1 Tax=Cyclotella cryptica TaxID=29204 RepID=A0ABD3Q0X1_9STRA
MISQDLFDETLLENEEELELSPEEALSETIDQFLSQLGDAATDRTNGGPLSHLVLLHPSSTEGRLLRQHRNQFQISLNALDAFVDVDGSVRLESEDAFDVAVRCLREVGEKCGGSGEVGSALPYLVMIQNSSSIYTLMSFLGVIDPSSLSLDSNHLVLLETVTTLIRVLSTPAAEDDERCHSIRVQVKDLFVPSLGRVVSLSAAYLNLLYRDCGDFDMAEKVLLHLVQLSTVATKACEAAKVAFVQAAIPSVIDLLHGGVSKRGGVVVLASMFVHFSKTAGNSHNNHDNNRRIIEAACILLATLCRYDDFREPSSSSGPIGASGANTSSAHDHAMEFHRAGVETKLIDIAKGVLNDVERYDDGELGTVTKSAAAVLTALRVLAVNDDIIQTMVALGVLPVVTKALELGCKDIDQANNDKERINSPNPRLASAALGLLRNLCGNDEIKTNLCLGSSDPSSPFSTPSSLPHILHAMQLYPSTATVQEHACGTLAAMTLRRPGNARAIIDAGGPRCILAAMKRHDMNSSVQRQGALAVRNIVSRLLRECPEEGDKNKEERAAIRDAFLELGAEDTLRNITGCHQGSVDEAYAALRDLGCTVSLVKFNADDVNQLNQVQRTMMFGEKHNSNFRPVYEDSADLENCVEEAISQFS